MKKPIKLIIPLLLLLAGGAWWYFTQHKAEENRLTLYGNVEIREVELAFRQPGRIQEMLVDEGNVVKKGEILAKLDDRPYRDALAAAQAGARQAEAELEKFKKGNRSQEIRRAEASVLQAKASLKRFEADLKRQSELALSGAASQKNLEAIVSARDEAAAILKAAQETLSLQKEGFRTEEIAAAKAFLAAKNAAVDQAKTALEDTILAAPNDSVIQLRVREPGSMVTNKDVVYTLSLPSPVYLRAYVAETQLGRVAPGTRVTVKTDSSEKLYEGQVGFVSPRAEFTPKSVETAELRTDLVYRLRIVVSNADSGLLQGMPVTIWLTN